jgi:hypothetical protein
VRQLMRLYWKKLALLGVAGLEYLEPERLAAAA